MFRKNRIIGNIKHQLIFIYFFSTAVQNFCCPTFPSLKDLLSCQLLIVTTIFLAKALNQYTSYQKIDSWKKFCQNAKPYCTIRIFLSDKHYKKLHEDIDGCQWIWQIRLLAINYPP